MIPINKLVIMLAFLIQGFGADCQAGDKGYSLLFSDGNHADGWAIGVRSVYILTDTTLAFTRHPQTSSADTVILLTSDQKAILGEIKSIKWDSLKDWYYNECIMATSGEEYFLSATTDTGTKKISLHHYYLREIDQLTDCLNRILPAQYKIRYLSPEFRQDCDLIKEHSK